MNNGWKACMHRNKAGTQTGKLSLQVKPTTKACIWPRKPYRQANRHGRPQASCTTIRWI